jgi:transposase
VSWAWANKVKLYFTPTNASWLNRIECQFTALKEFALSNSDYRSHEELQEAIESYVRWRNGDRPLTKESWHAFQRRQSKP